VKKKIYKFKKYSKKNKFRGNLTNLITLFCLATPEYCKLFKSLDGNLKKFIKSIINVPGTELENFLTLEIKNKIIGFASTYSSLEISRRQLKTNLIMRNFLNNKNKLLFIKKIQKNINLLPAINKQALYLSRNAILNKYQRKGLGYVLFKKILENIGSYKSICLHVKLSNREAQNFYTRIGFNKIIKKNNYAVYEKK